MDAIIVGGTTSGVGKTTVAVGLMGALRRIPSPARGLVLAGTASGLSSRY